MDENGSKRDIPAHLFVGLNTATAITVAVFFVIDARTVTAVAIFTDSVVRAVRAVYTT